ncbi:MAG: glutaminyl-peptide cyclotransferase [Thermoleophilaceae bacterium]|nr:glutaminyl-peptide cyclotransferase [Thermoleophilaceae bacterium]
MGPLKALARGAALAACGLGLGASTAGPSTAAPAARFDTNAAWTLVRTQLAYGQRPAGSPQLRALARRLRPLLPHGRFESLPGHPGLRNIVGTLPGRRPAVVIGAHYDTLADPQGFVGANNGAAGTAVVVEAARALAAMKSPRGAREIRFVLFDGEEPPSGLPEDSPDFYSSGLRGSRAYVAAHRGQTAEMVLLDYVANKRLSIPREETSTPWLWSSLRRAAGSVGAAGVFPRAVGPGFLDDHTPFLRAGVPAIDLIDPAYDGHSVTDRLDKLSRRSVAHVGATLVALARKLR